MGGISYTTSESPSPIMNRPRALLIGLGRGLGRVNESSVGLSYIARSSGVDWETTLSIAEGLDQELVSISFLF